jgi:hypothetical protein
MDEDAEFVLAKAALLNIYFELYRENQVPDGGSKHWLAQLHEIRAIAQERIIVAADDSVFTSLQSELGASSPYGCSGYHPAETALHGRNFALTILPRRTIEVISAKIPECRGNLQLTVGRFDLGNGDPKTFADIDFDDNLAFLGHSADVIDHWVTGSGTNPILIYEYLKARYPEANLGYVVERKGQLRLLPR